MRIAPAFVLVACALVLPNHARAYRTFADDPAIGVRARWASTEIDWELDISELHGSVSRLDLENAANTAWSTLASTECGHFTFRHAGTTGRAGAPNDRRNTISVVASGWADRGLPADQAAYTDVQIEIGEDGFARIVEADIYLDFEHYTFGDGADDTLDLTTVLLHEGMHAWAGLLHPCEVDGAGGAPDCADRPEARASALYPIYGEGGGRVLAPDDAAGICAIYGACEPACPMDSDCVDGMCVPRPCTGDDCFMCMDECGGTQCSSEMACDEGACAIAGPSAGYCLPLGSFGAECARASDCGSGRCLTSERAGSFCTMECFDDAICPMGLYCASVGARRVCAPTSPPSCTASPTSRPGLPPLSLFATAIALGLALRRRRSS